MADQDTPVQDTEEPQAADTAVPEDASAAATTQAEAESSVELLLEDARAKADAHWDQCLRLQAEIENLQRRARRDLENAHKFGLEKIAGELLPVKDSLEMGLAAVDGDNIDPMKLKEGKELTLRMLAGVMEKFGITELNPEGEPFNPEFHQAMSMLPRDDVAPNTVVTVVQKGYLLNDRLIRPAMVVVSAAGQTPKVDERA